MLNRVILIGRLVADPELKYTPSGGFSWTSAVGGGSAPGVTLPTVLLSLARDTESPDALEQWLRSLDPPVIARIEHDRVVLDLRTVLPDQDTVLISLLTNA